MTRGSDREELRDRRSVGMDFITEDGYQVKPGMQEEYQQWVIANQDALRRALPEGIEYIGTYVAVFGSDYTGGTFRDLFRIDSYGALDRMAAEGRRPGSELARLQREGSRFVDMTRSPERWTHNLYKNVVDATIIDVEASEEKELVGAGR
jgi:hypothetical protein